MPHVCFFFLLFKAFYKFKDILSFFYSPKFIKILSSSLTTELLVLSQKTKPKPNIIIANFLKPRKQNISPKKEKMQIEKKKIKQTNQQRNPPNSTKCRQMESPRRFLGSIICMSITPKHELCSGVVNVSHAISLEKTVLFLFFHFN